MLKMAQIEYIKHLYEVEEKSLNEIAKLTVSYTHLDVYKRQITISLE